MPQSEAGYRAGQGKKETRAPAATRGGLYRALTRAGLAGRGAIRALRALVLVHPLVGDLDEPHHVLGRLGHLGAAGAQTHSRWQPRGGRVAREVHLERDAPAAGLFLAAGEENQELVTAPAEDVVGLADVAEEKRRHLAEHAIAGVVPERVIHGLEAIDVDEEHRHRNPVAAVPLQLSPDDLLEEAAVAAAGQGIGDDQPAQLALRHLEPAIRAPQLERHVLEGHQLHAERGEEIQNQAERERSGRAGRARCLDAQDHPDVRGGDEEQRHADHRGPEHPHLTEQEEVADRSRRHRTRDEDVPGREDRRLVERHRRERKPEQHGEQHERVPAPDARPRRIRVGADDEEERAQDAEELGDAKRHERHLVAPVDRCRRQEHARRHQEPAARPEEDVQAAAIEEKEEEQTRDDKRTGAGNTPEVDVRIVRD